MSGERPPIVVIFNRRALAARALGRSGLAEGLRERRIDHEIIDTGTVEDTRRAAKEAAEAGKVAVGAGGDGTALDVVNGTLAAGIPSPMMGIVPLGTGNDLVRALGRVGAGLEQALDALAEFKTCSIDVGQVNGDEYFLNVLGVGFDAQVACRRAGQRFRIPSYFPGIVRTFFTYRPRVYRASCPGGGHEGKALMVTVMNGSQEGGGFRVAPAARLDDGLLDVYWIDPVSIWEFGRYVWAVRWGTHERLPMVHKWQTGRMTMESDTPLNYHLDGECRKLAEGERLEVVVHPRRLRMII
jgi:diacylglycerol kinase (ATP)